MGIKEFKKDWKEIRGRTLKFLESVPEDKWNWRPHELLGTFGMQVRHMVKSQEAYIKGMKNGTVSFDDKDFDSEIEKDKEKGIGKLRELDEELLGSLKELEGDKEILFRDGVVGDEKVKLETVLQYLIEHEYYHQGIFTCYGRIAGMGKFLFM